MKQLSHRDSRCMKLFTKKIVLFLKPSRLQFLIFLGFLFVTLQGFILPSLCHFSGPSDMAPPKPTYCAFEVKTESDFFFFAAVIVTLPLYLLALPFVSLLLRISLNNSILVVGEIVIALFYFYVLSHLVAVCFRRILGKSRLQPSK